MKFYRLEVANNNDLLGLLIGDEVLISTVVLPTGNGKDIGLFKIRGEFFLSSFTVYGSQILFLGGKMRVEQSKNVTIIGKVIDVNICKKVCISN